MKIYVFLIKPRVGLLPKLYKTICELSGGQGVEKYCLSHTVKEKPVLLSTVDV
jgi:hypothetical protein